VRARPIPPRLASASFARRLAQAERRPLDPLSAGDRDGIAQPHARGARPAREHDALLRRTHCAACGPPAEERILEIADDANTKAVRRCGIQSIAWKARAANQPKSRFVERPGKPWPAASTRCSQVCAARSASG
jgi:hypothetical protein